MLFRFVVLAFACRIMPIVLSFHVRTRHFRNAKVDGIGHSSYDDEWRSHSSVTASISSSGSLFLLDFSYSSGTFSLQPLPETFKKAALLPICHLLFYSRAPQNSAFGARSQSPDSAWSSLHVNVLLSLVPSFLLIFFWLSVCLFVTVSFCTVLFDCPISQQKIAIRLLACKKIVNRRRIDGSYDRWLNLSFRKKHDSIFLWINEKINYTFS